MIFTHKIREQMRKVSRTLVSGGAGAARTAIQRKLREMPGILHAPVPDFVKDLLTQLGVPSAQHGPAADRTRRSREADRFTVPPTHADADDEGQFLSRSYSNQAGTRDYKLYVPRGYAGKPIPMVVMLHGCTQNPDDFANGTHMNQLADEQQCIVVYPAQSQSANASKCWNWFKSIDQQRELGEPSIIAGITREVINNYQIDTGRVYVAGLSAGGAMAVIMATTYPDLYTAVGVHSGLPYASARDLPSALAAMRGNSPSSRLPDARTASIPMIVFHGDSDTTVNARNGEQLMQRNVAESVSTGSDRTSRYEPDVIIAQGQVPDGHRYTCTSHHGDDGRLLAEHWVIHGAGHAWAGGSSNGSYTDAKGPDASREMLRFFYAQSRRD